jgi:O-antigen/teichoic acid export membrane protein
MTADLQGGAPPAPAAERRRFGSIPFRRLSGFLTLPLISAIAPFLVLPVLLGFVGTEAWAGIAIGQAIGTGASTLVLLGWTVVGPSAVAEAPERQRELYTESLVSRLTVFVVAAPAAAAVAAVLAPSSARTAAALMALASAMLGLSATWYFVGTGKPGSIARYDTVPRVVATAAAAGLVAWRSEAWLYPAALIVTFTVMAVVVSARYCTRTPLTPLRTTARVVRQQWAAVGVSVQAALNAVLPMALLATVAPGVVAGFAALDRVTKFVVFAISPVGLAFQGWVSEPTEHPAQRRRTALVVTTGVGLVLAAGFLLTADVLLHVLFAAKIDVPFVAIAFSAVSIACVALGTTLGFHHLVPLKMSGWMALSTAISIVVASVGMALLAPRHGVAGAALAVMLAELSVVTTQSLALALRHRRAR